MMISSKDALDLYKRCRINAQIMEIMAMVPGKDFFYYHMNASLTLGKTLIDKANVTEVNYHFQYLQTLGYIAGSQSGVVELTEKGVEALRAGIMQELSMNAYKNYLDLKLRLLAISISVLSLMISMISIAIASLR